MTAYIKTDIPASGEFRGVGFGEVPRGMLSHWVVIKDGRIENYQAVVPSTWNAGPRNEQDQMGPYELSIIGTPVADPTKPLEVVRTIHSFVCALCRSLKNALKFNRTLTSSMVVLVAWNYWMRWQIVSI